MSVDAIDFGGLYREHMARAGRREKRVDDWDARAPVMSRGVFSGAYVEGFVARLDLTGCRTLLDVGCGPGTIALTVAPRLAHVYGLDFSPGMLDAFTQNAKARGLTNATPLLRAWEDPWDEVPVCDVVLASRSTQVADLEAALLKLHGHARRRVCLTHNVGGRFLDAAVYRALGRDDEPLPDYVYVLNILHRHGILPKVRAEVEDPNLILAMILDGAGVGILGTLIIQKHVERGRLIKLHARPIGIRQNLWLLASSHPNGSERVQALIDKLMSGYRLGL